MGGAEVDVSERVNFEYVRTRLVLYDPRYYFYNPTSQFKLLKGINHIYADSV